MGYLKGLKYDQEVAGFDYWGGEEACPACIADECLMVRVAEDQIPFGSDWDFEVPTVDGAELLNELGDPLRHERLAEVFAASFEDVVSVDYSLAAIGQPDARLSSGHATRSPRRRYVWGGGT